MKLKSSEIEVQGFQRALKRTLWLTGLLWLLLVLNEMFNLHLYRLTLFPRDPQQLIGIVFAPLVHGSFEHLVGNTLPLLILMTASFWRYPKASRRALPVIWVLSGLAVWLLGREAYHFGASGINHGLMFFTFVSGVIRKDRAAIAIAMGVFFLYGTMIWSVFPADPAVSWEGHLFGALSGIVMAVVLQNLDRPPLSPADVPIAEDGDDPVIGDQWRMPPSREESPPVQPNSDYTSRR